MTHYVPYFTQQRARVMLAVCGRFINPGEHTVEPTCPKCAAWLVADDAEARALSSKWDAETAAKQGVR